MIRLAFFDDVAHWQMVARCKEVNDNKPFMMRVRGWCDIHFLRTHGITLNGKGKS